MLEGTNLPLIILLIIIIEIAISLNQWTTYLSRPNEKTRLYHLILLVLLILYNIAEGFFPDHRISFIPEVMQNFLGYGFGYVFAAYCPYYFYKTMEIPALRFHGRFGFLFVLIPLLFFYWVLYPINRDISFTRKYVYLIPAAYALTLFGTAIRSIIKEYKINRDRSLAYERSLIFLAVFPVSVTPIFGGWLGMEKWIITTVFNVGFLIVNFIFMRQLVRKSKLELDMLTELSDRIKIYNSEASTNEKLVLEYNCKKYNLSKREVEVLTLIINGYEYKRVATELFISERTVEKHVQNMFNKVGVTNKTKLIKQLSSPES